MGPPSKMMSVLEAGVISDIVNGNRGCSSDGGDGDGGDGDGSDGGGDGDGGSDGGGGGGDGGGGGGDGGGDDGDGGRLVDIGEMREAGRLMRTVAVVVMMMVMVVVLYSSDCDVFRVGLAYMGIV